MRERIQKIIAAAGNCSRRAAEALIEGGRVTVNGAKAALGQSADAVDDDIRVDGRPLAGEKKSVYIMLNKPRGYVTTLSDERGRKTVAELTRGCGERVFPCGRLDMASEGLLILTNDGETANRLTHPSHEIKKTYRVSVRGENIRSGIERLRGEFTLDGKKLRPAEIELIREEDSAAAILISVFEGRNRQIRRMCELSGLTVARLIRISEGELNLGGLRSGHWRRLTDGELAYIRSLGARKK